ncbi:transcriptional regulator [Enemella evansiae]|uniref:Transcriptional regulator n=1 Tax=Enemella evansiae TaxID=2016499 RepID=A0A255GF51_9ACTN|nr:metalloregulator ArsR/SmtB family transcription factor [Enemella evansiae]OYO07586.1 transcriptional regulator [Enemella evansiae]OYO14488.1 transcriptional regulator [Enemella evansiae]OYO18016.1 transcriptional regulator [Enemella evansiae]
MAHPPLTEAEADALAEVLQGIASPVRLRVLALLRHGPHTVGELTAELGVGQSTVSNHLRVLRHVKLVAGDRDGRTVSYRLLDAHVAQFLDQAIEHMGHVEVDGS